MFREPGSETSSNKFEPEINQDLLEEVDDTYSDYSLNPERDAELAKTLIETDSYINRIQLTLENKYLKQTRVKKDGKWEYSKVPTQIPMTKPLANEFGISQIIGRVKSVISHVTSLGYIDKQQYGLFMARFIKDFVRSLISHRKDWGIEPNTLRDIRRIVVDGTQLYLTRPIGRIEFNALTRYNSQNEPKEKGFVDSLGDKFKRKGGMYG